MDAIFIKNISKLKKSTFSKYTYRISSKQATILGMMYGLNLPPAVVPTK